MKFYNMHKFHNEEPDEDGNVVEIHLDKGEMTAEEMQKYINDFYRSVSFGVLIISHIDIETDTVHFSSDVV